MSADNDAALRVRALRAAGFSYVAIAGLVGVSERTVYRWERGDTAPETRAVLDQLVKVSDPYMQTGGSKP